MKVAIYLENDMLPDKYGKYADPQFCFEGNPVVSFPFEISEVPEGTESLALTFLDWDAIPVGGFCWIHWIACNIPPDTTHIPEDASATGAVAMVQGSNSASSPRIKGSKDPRVIHRYVGPYPPDKDHRYSLTVYALDCTLDLAEGYFLNDFLWAAEGHILETAVQHVMSRA